MAKRPNYRWAIVNDNVVRVTAQKVIDGRYECKADDGSTFVVSKYDIYDTLHEANDALNEELPE